MGMGLLVGLIDFLGDLFILVLGFSVLVLLVVVLVVYINDRLIQKTDAILRNYPVIGHMRSILSELGAFFRQYFFALDREEMPFNRAERNWVYENSSHREMGTIPFGSTKSLTPVGTITFVNTMFPLLQEDYGEVESVVIGQGDCTYTGRSIINISGMSYGAISKPAVLALSGGAAAIGCWMNTGEGGLSDWHLQGGADIVFQIGTARYGVRDQDGNLSDDRLRELAALKQVKMFEIKLSQGAKPGKGGILPGNKVTEEIARIRGIDPGSPSYSPNRHRGIASVGALLDNIVHIRNLTGKPVGFKAAFGTGDWMNEFCTEVNRRGLDSAPDFITVDGGDGGTGAAPMVLMDNLGLAVQESLPRVVDKLLEYGLRERIKVICSGKLIIPVMVAWALATGADFVTSARGFMFSIGCIQALKCNQNTCPTGITTHKRSLQKGLNPEVKSVRVANYAHNITEAVEMISHSCGISNPRELRRHHVRVMQSNGRSVRMSKLYPYPGVRNEA